MVRIEVSPGITRIRLDPGSRETFTPVSFRDEQGEYLCQTDCVFAPRPVWRFSGTDGSSEVKQTANGEVVSFEGGERRLVREA